MSVLVITSRSARITCLRASDDQAERVAAGLRVDHRHHRLDMEHLAERAVGGEGLQDRRRIGEPAGLDHDAAEVGQFAALALDHHAAQRLLQIAARDAAQAAIAEQHGLVGARAHQRVVDAGGAEFVDHHRGALPFRRRRESARSSVVLPAPRKPVTTVTGTRGAALALEPAPEAPGGRGGEELVQAYLTSPRSARSIPSGARSGRHRVLSTRCPPGALRPHK